MPIGITTGQGSSGTRTELEYDGTGSRLVKRALTGDTTSESLTALTYDVGELFEEKTTFMAGTCLATADPSTCTPLSRTYDYRIYAGGRQVAQVHTGGTETKTYYLHDDQLGSTSAMTDASGDLVETRDYEPFGAARGGVDFSQSGVTSGFAGLEHDPELGLVNMRGRLYDPVMGRFISPDPLVTQPFREAGLNRYSYVENNPLNFVDPSGFQGEDRGSEPGAPSPPGPSGGEPSGYYQVAPPGVDASSSSGWAAAHGISSLQPIGTAGEIFGATGDFANWIVWAPASARATTSSAQQERSSAGADQAGSAPGPSQQADPSTPTGAATGQGTPATATTQPTDDVPDGAAAGSAAPNGGWTGGNTGSPSTSSPAPRTAQGGGYSIPNPWWENQILAHPVRTWAAVTVGLSAAVVGGVELAGTAISEQTAARMIRGGISGGLSAAIKTGDPTKIALGVAIGATVSAVNPFGGIGNSGVWGSRAIAGALSTGTTSIFNQALGSTLDTGHPRVSVGAVAISAGGGAVFGGVFGSTNPEGLSIPIQGAIFQGIGSGAAAGVVGGAAGVTVQF
jgi:RHS repeat-associated protein